MTPLPSGMGAENSIACVVVARNHWQLSTQAGCQLVIAGYPPFRYDARGGGGISAVQANDGDGANVIPLDFSAHDLVIPPLDAARGRFLGLPLPPGLSIQIHPERLAGELNPLTGALRLQFRSRFRLTLGSANTPLYQASDLLVDTALTSGEVSSRRHQRTGRALSADGTATLVGTAAIEPCREAWLNRFLGLPDEALAVMHLTLRPL